jgi:hypothetical protein
MRETVKGRELKVAANARRSRSPDVVLNQVKHTTLNIHIYRPLMVFSYVDNFSDWSLRCRQVYKRFEQEMYEDASKNIDLGEYAKVRKKYGHGRNNLIHAFQTESMKEAERRVLEITKSEKDTKTVMDAVRYLEHRYYERWDAFEGDLARCRDALQALWKAKSKEIILDISRFLDLRVPAEVPFYLIHMKRGSAGMARGDGITVEMGDPEHAEWALDTVIHEMMHYTEIVGKRDTKELLRKEGLALGGAEEISPADSVGEAIFGLVTPDGLLSERIGIGKRKDLKERLARTDLPEVQRRLYQDETRLKDIVDDYFTRKVVNGERLSYSNLIRKIAETYRT